jgi:hypothetical protein
MEVLGYVDRFLPQCGVSHKEYFVGLNGVLEALDFIDQIIVDLQAASGIE